MIILKNFCKYLYKAKIELSILVFFIACDLITKNLVQANMQIYQSITIIPNFFYIIYTTNDLAAFGSAFGLEKIFGNSGIMIFFICITVFVCTFFLIYLYKIRNQNIWLRISVALIIAGALGNMLDRVFLNYVRDFFAFILFGWSAPIFNLADSVLTIGIPMFIISYIICSLSNKKIEYSNKNIL